MKHIVFIFLLTNFILTAIGQTFQPINPSNSASHYQGVNTNAYNVNRNQIVNPSMLNMQQQNAEAMQKLGYMPVPTQQQIDNGEYARLVEAKRQERMKLVKDILYENKRDLQEQEISNKDLAFKLSERIYLNSAQEIMYMMDGRKKADIKRAIFLAENAYYDSTLSYQKFTAQINQIVNTCKLLAKSENLNYESKYVRTSLLKRYFSDTLNYSVNGKSHIHIPFKYDFDDYMGEKDWTKMFVTKLINTDSGQCHSLPFLFRAIAGYAGQTDHSVPEQTDHLFCWRRI